MPLDHLFSPLTIRDCTIRNRIFTTGHQTNLVSDGLPNEALKAYLSDRARGGAGLVIVEIAAIHETAQFNNFTILGYRDECIAGYRQLAKAVHEQDCRIFGQLFHPGREVLGMNSDGTRKVTYAPSPVPHERYLHMPRALPLALIEELVEGYGDTALRMKTAGLDGVEVVGSHGYLPAQFLNPRTNQRSDRYGGSAENRLRFLSDVAVNIRRKVGEEMVIGLRISGDDMDQNGLKPEESLPAISELDAAGLFDYFNVTAGASSTASASFHIVPSMSYEAGYLAPFSAQVKSQISSPVFVAGRINQPQIADRVIAENQADMCGMTRAMIADPQMPNKAFEGRFEDIRACIACNQACIGHIQLDAHISCIQRPETGRELGAGIIEKAPERKRVIVVGGGPAGMKAAVVASQRGHEVRLYERGQKLGGQALLGQLLPGRAEFGGLVTNLERELELNQIAVKKSVDVTPELLLQEQPDTVVLATGATPHRPALEGEENMLDAWQVLRQEVEVGGRVVVADWRGDWVGLGVAELLARNGHHVRLITTCRAPGEYLQFYLRDRWAGVLGSLGVEIIPYARLFGFDGDTAYCVQTAMNEPIVLENTDSVVMCLGHTPDARLEDALQALRPPFDVKIIGDCLAPRTAEEAILDGLVVAREI
jgi:2,4-dienoyl-CoA reductase-like NADH-dependent reductase (Old Yellow Enzyme family)/thioredoxin reductase